MLFRIVVAYETIWSFLSIPVFSIIPFFLFISTLSTEQFEDENITDVRLTRSMLLD